MRIGAYCLMSHGRAFGVAFTASVEGPERGEARLVAEGESVPGSVLLIGNTNSRYRFSIGAKDDRGSKPSGSRTRNPLLQPEKKGESESVRGVAISPVGGLSSNQFPASWSKTENHVCAF